MKRLIVIILCAGLTYWMASASAAPVVGKLAARAALLEAI